MINSLLRAIEPLRNWRIQSAIYLAIALVITSFAALQPDPVDSVVRTSSIPATVCPKFDDEVRTTALLPSSKTRIKSAASRKPNFIKARVNPYLINNNSIVVEGSEVTSAVIRTRSGAFTAATTCLIGDGDQWFVGAKGSLGSRSRILAINSGLSTSSLEVTAYTSEGLAGTRSLAIPAVSQREIRVDALAPGATATAIRVLTQSGRVSTYLIEEASRGLQTLGGDFIASQSPSTELTIPAIPASRAGRSITDHRIYVIATGNRAAVIDVELLSGGSRFTPVGLSEVTVEPGQLQQLRLPKELGRRPASVLIKSTEEIAATVSSSIGNEFAWSAPALGIQEFTINVGGLEPFMTFVAKAIRVEVEITSRTGKKSLERLTGSEILNWKVPANSRRISIMSAEAIHLGMSWSTGDGFTSMALNPGTELERSSTPIFDIDALFDR